jgi:hypothetical protein
MADMSQPSDRIERLHNHRVRVAAAETAEDRAFRPAETMEALVLRVIGGWENLVAEVNFTRFHAAGYAAGPLDQERIAKAMRSLADDSGVRWPHDEWSTWAARAKFARDMLAHMLYIESVTGERPNRALNITLLGLPGQPRKAADGNPAELTWRDPIWSTQTRYSAPISEQSLIAALGGLKWMIACCKGLGRIRQLLAHPDADLPDDKVIEAFMWQVNWWLPEWGDPETTPLTVGHIRLRPGQKN